MKADIASKSIFGKMRAGDGARYTGGIEPDEINGFRHTSFPQRYLSRRYCAWVGVMKPSFISAMLMEP